MSGNIVVLNKLVDEGKLSKQIQVKNVIVQNKQGFNSLFRGNYGVRVEMETNWYNVFIDFGAGEDKKDRDFLKSEYDLYSVFSTDYNVMEYDENLDVLIIYNGKRIKVQVLL